LASQGQRAALYLPKNPRGEELLLLLLLALFRKKKKKKKPKNAHQRESNMSEAGLPNSAQKHC
jgi:hypothetical protein